MQRSLKQLLTLNNSSSNNDDSIRDKSDNCEVATAEGTTEAIPVTPVTIAVTESAPIPQKLFTVDSANETSSSGSTENDFEIVSNESSPIASPTTIMAEHGEINGDGVHFGLGDEIEDTDKFPKTLNNPKGVSDMELREKRQRLR